ncbi:MAG: hypothetical protein ACREK6_08665 [Candidatus Rokuibacteriota bacterium]
MAEAVGPIWTGGFEYEDSQGFRIQFLPDKHNDELQREGKPPVYYWMPGQVRLARKTGSGDYKFHLIHFVGVQSADTTVGVEGTREVAGGVLSLTTTAAFPAGVLEQAEQKLLNRFRGKDQKYWGWRTPAAPMFRAVPITANVTAITNLAPDASGTVPVATGGSPGGAPAPTDGGGAATSSGGPPRSTIAVRPADMTRRVPHGRGFRGPSNLDAWHWKLQGQGPGSIVPTGENAYSGLIGDLPAAIVWQGFHGSYSPIAVVQALKIPVWSQALRIKIDGNWDRIFQHFSAHAKVDNFWFDADIKAEFNNMRISGGITVSLEIDGTIPGADKMEQEANKRIDIIYQKFMEAAQKVIFEPPPPNVQPAVTSGGGGLFGWGGGFALKYRRDSTSLNLHYNETFDKRYNLDHVISSTLEGFYDEIKQDPAAEKKYFTTLYLDDWSRKVTRIVKPIVNWPDPTKQWVGDPVSFLSVELGYPSARGDIQWAAHVFQSTDTGDTTRWEMAVTKKNADDVTNPPAGWTPDKMFVRRRVHLNEPPGESDSPFMRVFVEKNVVDLDPGENGRLTNENTLEVRADSVGKLELGPIALDVELENSKQVIEVEFECKGTRHDGTRRNPTKFTWKADDQDEPRVWEIFTGQLDFVPAYKYRVRVIVRGTIFSQGMEWTGPWVEASGNGPLMVSVPTADDPGVTRRSLITGAESAVEGFPARPDGTGGAVGRPPRTGGTGAPAKRGVSDLMPAGEGLRMRDLEAAYARATVPDRGATRMAGGYRIDAEKGSPRMPAPPTAPRAAAHETGSAPRKGDRAAAHTRTWRAEEPRALELAEGWSTGSSQGTDDH